MFVLNVVAATIGYIVLGSLAAIAVIMLVAYIAHWFKHGESPGASVDRLFKEEVDQPRQLSMFDPDDDIKYVP